MASEQSEVTNRSLKQFIRYINSMDLEKIDHPKKTDVNEHLSAEMKHYNRK